MPVKLTVGSVLMGNASHSHCSHLTTQGVGHVPWQLAPQTNPITIIDDQGAHPGTPKM